MITLSEDQYRSLVSEDAGFCVACGEECGPVEPDARGYTCESCDEPEVYGLEELLMMGKVEITAEAR